MHADHRVGKNGHEAVRQPMSSFAPGADILDKGQKVGGVGIQRTRRFCHRFGGVDALVECIPKTVVYPDRQVSQQKFALGVASEITPAQIRGSIHEIYKMSIWEGVRHARHCIGKPASVNRRALIA